MSPYKIVNETWLTRFVAEYGDMALKTISGEIYGSGLFKVSLLFCAIISLSSIAWGIQARQFSRKGIFFFLAFTLLYPHGGKPIGYIATNAVGRVLTGVFEKAVNKIVANTGNVASSNNLPPGAVMEMVVAAATAKVDKTETRALIQGFVVSCLPNAMRRDGTPAIFDDLFNFKSKFNQDEATGETVFSFEDNILDEKALANDNSYQKFRPGKSCLVGLKDMRMALATDLGQIPCVLTSRVISGSRESGGEVTDEAWFKRWKASNSKFKDISMNLRLAHAAAYEKSKLASEHGWDLNDPSGNWWKGTNTDVSLREMMIGLDNYTAEFGYRASDIKNLASNMSGNRWAFSLGASMKDLKERIELVPYYTATIQLLLKILCPIFLVTLLFQSFRFFFIWAGAWIASLLFPAVVSASRAIHNSIILSKLGIEQMLERHEGHNSLAYGVDLSQAKSLLGDFVPLAYAMVEQEIKIIAVLSGAIIAGSWIAGGGANGFVSWFSNSIQGTLTSQATSVAGKAIANRPLVRNAMIGGMVGGPVAASGSTAFTLVNNLRKSTDIPKFVGNMFSKRSST